jgi:hypothetical protein
MLHSAFRVREGIREVASSTVILQPVLVLAIQSLTTSHSGVSHIVLTRIWFTPNRSIRPLTLLDIFIGSIPLRLPTMGFITKFMKSNMALLMTFQIWYFLPMPFNMEGVICGLGPGIARAISNCSSVFQCPAQGSPITSCKKLWRLDCNEKLSGLEACLGAQSLIYIEN